MRYKDASEITEAFISDGWNADIKFTELPVDNATAIGSFFAGLIKQGHKLFQMSGSGNIFDDSGKLIFLNLSFQAKMQKARSLIENFCLEEYGSLSDFSNYRRIGVAYTTVTDAELELQVNANLIDFSIDTYLDGKLFQRNSYNSLNELISQELEWLSFDSLVAYSDQEISDFLKQSSKTAVPYLTDSLTGILEKTGDLDEARAERLKKKYGPID